MGTIKICTIEFYFLANTLHLNQQMQLFPKVWDSRSFDVRREIFEVI